MHHTAALNSLVYHPNYQTESMNSYITCHYSNTAIAYDTQTHRKTDRIGNIQVNMLLTSPQTNEAKLFDQIACSTK